MKYLLKHATIDKFIPFLYSPRSWPEPCREGRICPIKSKSRQIELPYALLICTYLKGFKLLIFCSWIFGSFMCKMYHFISSLSTTASILILVVICIERYLAIIHPMRCKQMLTLNRLRVRHLHQLHFNLMSMH